MANLRLISSFHREVPPYREVAEPLLVRSRTIHVRSVAYDFALHQHPYVTQLMSALIGKGVSGLLEADTDVARYQREFFPDYKPASGEVDPSKPEASVTVRPNPRLRYELDFSPQ